MALKQYNGPAGSFEYDDTQFAVSQNTGLLKYIGNEIRGEQIHIPEGILSCREMFSGSVIITPPEIPYGVKDTSRMFEGCRHLQNYPKIPNTVKDISGMFRGATFDPEVNMVTPDKIMNLINREMNNEIDNILVDWERENISIEEAFKNSGDLDTSKRELVNSELRARLAICQARLDGLQKEQEHLESEISRAVDMGAPHNYMTDTLSIKRAQIENIQTEMADLRQEIRYRAPSTLDILKTSAIDAKENIVSIGQKISKRILNRVDEMRMASSKFKGNIYRASEVAQLRYDLKLATIEKNISDKDLDATVNLYNKLMPGICKVSNQLNNVKEALSSFKAHLKGQDYKFDPGLTPTGKKLVERMYQTIADKMTANVQAEGRIEQIRLKIDEILPNLSPTEKQHSLDMVQEIDRKLSEITRSARNACQEKITSYEKIKDSQERGIASEFEKAMSAEEIADRYPMSIRNIDGYSNIEVTPERGFLYNEVAHETKVFTDEERNRMFEQTLNNISEYGSEHSREIIREVSERGVHVKEDHAQVLRASIKDDFERTPGRNDIMSSDFGKEIMQKYESSRESSTEARNEVLHEK